MVTLVSESRVKLIEKYESIIPEEVKELASIFDMEETINLLSGLDMSGKVTDRNTITIWETTGLGEFRRFYEVVCNLPMSETYTPKNRTLISYRPITEAFQING